MGPEIEQTASPPAGLLDVALSPGGKSHELIVRLGALAGPEDPLPTKGRRMHFNLFPAPNQRMKATEGGCMLSAEGKLGACAPGV